MWSRVQSTEAADITEIIDRKVGQSPDRILLCPQFNFQYNVGGGGVRGDTPNIIKILKRFQNQVANNEFIYPHRQLYKASSTIYHDPEVGDDLTERLKSSEFDLSVPSRKRKTDRPRERNEPARGMPRVRELGRHKTGDFSFRKM